MTQVQAVINHSQGLYKKGEIFELLNSKQGCCELEYDLGFTSNVKKIQCTICDIIRSTDTTVWWLQASAFRILRNHKPNIEININEEVLETSDQIPELV